MNFDSLPRFQKHQLQILAKIPEWSDTFETPEEEIMRQIKSAHAWAEGNPRLAPKKDIMRYLTNWFLKAKRHGWLLKKPRENYREKRSDSPIMDSSDWARMRDALRK